MIVIGSGAGGGVAAWRFTERGYRVLMLERGGDPVPGRDHLRNHRYAKYGQNTGPAREGNPREFVDSGVLKIVRPHEPGYNNNAMALGGGTRVYGAQAWRFHPLDFRMATTYGVPVESSLADWPISYEDLAPFYEEIEWTLGVAGSNPALNLPSRRPYPMDAPLISKRGTMLQSAAGKLGWDSQRVPLMVNTVERNGRAACIECQHCVGFPCPVEARGDTHNTVLPMAVASGRCEIWTGTQVTSLLTDPSGRVTGVRAMKDLTVVELSADIVILAAGAIESARLLLASRSAREPNGVGNNHDQVGRHLQGHYYPGALGLFTDPINEMRGPGPTVAVTEFNHGNPGIVGGGMLADDFLPLPAIFAAGTRPPQVPAVGLRLKEWVRHGYLRAFRITGPVQEIPSPESRVTLSPDRLDRNGMLVARLQGTTHSATVETAQFMAQRAGDWLRHAGATEVWESPVDLHLSAGQHQAGTCRMGFDPATSVVDAKQRVHGHENLLVCDGSVHPTNGGFNPFLTIMATSLRASSTF